jgi:hypothetical protein
MDQTMGRKRARKEHQNLRKNITLLPFSKKNPKIIVRISHRQRVK